MGRLVRTAPRHGYTLLEILVASVIAALLLGALYVTLDASLVRMDTGRDQVGGSDFARALIKKMATDIQASLGPMQPKSGGGALSAGGGNSGSTESGEGDTSSSGSGSGSGSADTSSGTGSNSTSSSSTSSSTTTDPATTGGVLTSNLPLQGGVYGTDKYLSVFMSRVPTAVTDPALAMDPTLAATSDLWKVTYYLNSEGQLCRQERPWVTAEGVRNSFEPDYTTELFDVIAPEVVDVTFEYYDGGVWAGTWDGSIAGIDGVTPIGPPRAIRVTLVLQFPGHNGQVAHKTIQQVIPLRSSPGDYVSPNDAAAMGTGSSTGGM